MQIDLHVPLALELPVIYSGQWKTITQELARHKITHYTDLNIRKIMVGSYVLNNALQTAGDI
jgi:hypothetical protein